MPDRAPLPPRAYEKRTGVRHNAPALPRTHGGLTVQLYPHSRAGRIGLRAAHPLSVRLQASPMRPSPSRSAVLGSGMKPSVAKPVVSAPVPASQLAAVAQLATKTCAAARYPNSFGVRTSEAVAHVPLRLLIMNCSTSAVCI